MSVSSGAGCSASGVGGGKAGFTMGDFASGLFDNLVDIIVTMSNRLVAIIRLKTRVFSICALTARAHQHRALYAPRACGTDFKGWSVTSASEVTNPSTR